MILTLQRDSLWTPVLALDRLNSWLRAEDFDQWRLRSALKRAIYYTKTQAILDLTRRWHVGLKRVMVLKNCRRCDGSGLWVPHDCYFWDGESRDDYRANYGERCRGCDGTGKALLLFVESVIGPVRWHTPIKEWHSSSLDTYVPFPTFYGAVNHQNALRWYAPAWDWEPNRPGRPLTCEQIERDIILVLRAWPHPLCFALDYEFHDRLEVVFGEPDVERAAAGLRRLIREWGICGTER